MALENKLQLKLTQKLILTPQLQQSIKLLQLPQLELSQTLTQELLENPMLEELVEKESEDSEDSEDTEERSDTDKEERPELSGDTETPLEKIFGFTTDEYFEERGSDGRDLGYFTGGVETPTPFERDNKKLGLYEYLLWQLRMTHTTGQIGTTAEIVIGNLNGAGYLQASIEEIVKMADVDVETAGAALELILSFDPPGVGARTLQECLVAQLKPLNLEGTLTEKILTDGFNELEKKKYKKLAAKFAATIDEIHEAVKIIGGLEPRPGSSYSSDETIHIIPDVYVEESEGKFIIILNDEGIPRLRISNYYRKLLSNKKALKQEEKEFLEEKFRAAIWLLKSLDQRNKTIYRVTESILKFQEEFFRRGRNYLTPMNLKDIAMDLEMHESTISRVTSNKYLQCSRGLFGFRFFFSNPIDSAGGGISSVIVKDLIKQLVSNENTASPLSDKEIVEILKDRNINIARRTVAKYREELKIPPYNRRKKWS